MPQHLRQHFVRVYGCLSVVLWLWLGVAVAESQDSPCVGRFFALAPNLPWDLHVDSAVAYLKQAGFDSCTVKHREDNHLTVGPYVACPCDSSAVGIGYFWGYEKKPPHIGFYSVHFPNCKACTRAYATLMGMGYRLIKSPAYTEVTMASRQISTGPNQGYRLNFWNECCPGNRLRLYREPKPGTRSDSSSTRKR